MHANVNITIVRFNQSIAYAQDKDDLHVPLLLETIPTPKQFRDAIESLMY